MALTKITNSAIADDIGLGGNPTTSTQTAGNSTTRIATTAFVSTAVANLVDSAPDTLNTLAELATSIGNNATLSSTLTSSIATKLPLAGGTLTGNLNLGDNVRARFGLDSDLQIYHDGSHSYIDDTGTGHLFVRSNGDGIYFRSSTNEEIAHFNVNGSVKLYHDNAEKLVTTATGIDVTGTVQADLLTTDDDVSGLTTLGRYSSGFAYSLLRPSASATGLEIRTNAGNALAHFLNDGTTKLHHNGTAKLATTSTGIDVTGNIGVSGTVDGVDIQTLNTTANAALPKAGGTMTGDLSINYAGNAKATIQAVGDYFPFLDMKRTGASSKTNYAWTQQIGSTGFFYIKDATNSHYPFILNTSGDVLLSSDTSAANPILTLDRSAGSATFAGTINTAAYGSVLATTQFNQNVMKSSVANQKGAFVRMAVSNEGNPTYAFEDDTNTGMFTSGADTLNFTTAGTERMRITAAGKVGIGTSNPQDALDIDWDAEGVATDYSGIRVRAYRPHINLIDRSAYGSTNGKNFQIKADLAKLSFNATSADNEVFDVTRMVIDGSGNVGIGTTAPIGKLDFGGSLGTGKVYLNSNVDLRGWGQDMSGNGYEFSNFFPTNGSGRYSIGTYNGTTYSEKLVVESGGNVGIGTSSPDAHLDISAAAGTTGSNAPTLRLTNSSNVDYTVGSPIGALEYYHSESSGAAFPGVAASIKAVVEVTHGHQVGLAFSTANVDTAATERMRITTSGNVGIGTTTPAYPLEIANNSTLSFAYQRTGVSAKKWGFDSDNAATYWVNITDNVRPLTLLNGGNIGIGTLSPNTNVQVYHATDDTSINVNHGTGGSYPKKSGISFGAISTSLGGDATFTGGAGIQAINTAAANNLTEMAFFTTSGGAPTERMRIDELGNVGIGTQTPGAKLEVRNSTTATDTIAASAGLAVAGNYHNLLLGDGANYAVGLRRHITVSNPSYLNPRLDFFVQNTSTYLPADRGVKMTILGNGNVGIGETSPGQKLQVNGNIRADGHYYVGGQIVIDSSRNLTNIGTISSGAISATGSANSGSASHLPAFLASGNYGGGIATRDTKESGWYQQTNGADWHFYHNRTVASDTPASKIVLSFNSSGNATFAGNVGIGTSTPSRKFEIHENTTNLTIGEKTGYTPSAYGPVFETNANALVLPATAYLSGSQAYVQNNSSSLRLNGDNGIQFRYYDGSAGQEGMRLTNTGNVGIGTTAPAVNLHIKDPSGEAGLVIQAGSNTDSSTITFGDSVDVSRGSIEYTSTDDIVFSNNNLTERLRIRYTGNVGIGTASPSQKLQVDGAIKVDNDSSYEDTADNFYGGIVCETPIYKEYQCKWSGLDHHETNIYVPSYFMSEITFTQHQSNGGTDINRLFKAKFANNHTHHELETIHDSGDTWSMTTAITATDHNLIATGATGSGAHGRLRIVETYGSGSYSFSTLTMRVYYGTPSNITHTYG